MQSLATKVKAGKLSGEDARVKLTAKHNELRARQQNELAAQEQLDNQRTMQAYELLKQNNYKLEMPTVAPVHSSPTQTDCYKIGEQLHCTTR
jgi:ParB-like chromosome segregation protein Spo0J